MASNFGEDKEWNELLLEAEIAASTARVRGRKRAVKALECFEELVSLSKTRDGKVRALVGVVLCYISFGRYKKAYKKACRALKLTKTGLAKHTNCSRYIRKLAKESHTLAARRYLDSLNSDQKNRREEKKMSDIERLIIEGDQALASGGIKEATGLYRQAIMAVLENNNLKDFKQEAHARRQLGQLYMQLGDERNLERALTQFKAAEGTSGCATPVDLDGMNEAKKLILICLKKLDAL